MKSTDARDKSDNTALDLMFLGGVGNDVTGSSTLVAFTVGNQKKYGLIDVGGFQGEDNRNFFYPVKAENIAFVIITHAHYDHIGLLPKLYHDGFRGKIYITEQAMAQGNYLLEDAAHIQEYELDGYAIRRKDAEQGKQNLEKQKAKLSALRDVRNIDNSISQYEEILENALYTIDDVRGLRTLFVVTRPNTLVSVIDNLLSFRFFVNPHQNGAVEVELFYGDMRQKLGVFFSGDMGSSQSLLYRARDSFRIDESIDYAVMESLHGIEEREETLEESEKRLERIIVDGVKNGKNIILAGFSLDRNAMLVHLINRMFDKGLKFDAYFDSPLGFLELSLYQSYYAREHDDKNYPEDDKWFKDLGKKPFDLSRFAKTVKTINHHIELLNTSGPKVVITASANGTGGRVVDFFDKFVQDDHTIFVFCGWIFPKSPSFLLHRAEKGKMVELGGKRYIKRCETIRLHGFSSHGYYDEFLSILQTFPSKKGVILNHAEREAKEALVDMIESPKYQTKVPSVGDAYHLSKIDGIELLTEGDKMNLFGDALLDYNYRNFLLEVERGKETQES